jgi:hypothetical protein
VASYVRILGEQRTITYNISEDYIFAYLLVCVYRELETQELLKYFQRFFEERKWGELFIARKESLTYTAGADIWQRAAVMITNEQQTLFNLIFSSFE